MKRFTRFRVRAVRPAEYDQEAFCRACLDHIQRPKHFPPIACFDDAVMDFIVSMLRTERWRDFDPRRGPLPAFVNRWFSQWVRFGGGYKVTGQSRGRTERRKRKPMAADDARIVTRQDFVAESEAIFQTLRLATGAIPTEVADIVDTAIRVAAFGNNPYRGAACVEGCPVAVVRAAVRKARKAAGPYVR